MTSSEATPAEIEELIAGLPAFAPLPPDVRALVADSFETVDHPFGSVIVREGDPADAFYIVASGSARVVKRGDDGDEIPLNVLHRGDSFGETALLEQATRVATVRASTPVRALRLHRSVFTALNSTYPEVHTAFEALEHERTLSNFFRIHSSVSKLPNAALGALLG